MQIRPARALPAIVGLALATLAVLAAPALAGDVPIDLKVTNATQVPLQIVPGGGSRCWHNENFDHYEQRTVSPGQTRTMRSYARQDLPCVNGDHYRGLDIFVQYGDGSWHNPIAESDTFRANSGPWQFELAYDVSFAGGEQAPFQLRGMFDRWFPINAGQRGTSGLGGLICISGVEAHDGPNPRTIEMRVTSNIAQCANQPDQVTSEFTYNPKSTRTAAPTPSDEPLPKSVAPPRVSLGAGPEIVDFFDIARAVCDWAHPDPRWNDRGCDQIGNPEKWDLHNVSADVRNMTQLNPLVPITGVTLIDGPFRKDNFTDRPGELKYTYKVKQGESQETETVKGFKKTFGIEGGVSRKIGDLAKLDLKLSGEFEWNDETNQTQKKDSTIQRSIDDSTETEPHGTTRVYVFQSHTDLDFHFAVDLSAGLPNTAQAVRTPVARALGISSSRIQPCIGLLTAESEPNSIISFGNWLHSQGYSPESVNVTSSQATYLRALPGFITGSSDLCPGWREPYAEKFPAAVSFKGETAVRLHAGGPAEIGYAPKGPLELRICSFFDPAGKQNDEPNPHPSGDPCVSEDKGKQTLERPQGSVVGPEDANAAGVSTGGSGSELIIAAAGGRTDTLIGGAGKFDLLQGAAGRQRMFGGAGEDFLSGEGGDDLLVGGGGDDSLEGGAGRDVLRDDAGHNSLHGGAGNDRLLSSGKAESGLYGDAGDDTLTLRGSGRSIMLGGQGDDTYRVSDGASAARAVEFAGEGTDTMLTDRSATLPPNVERGVAATARGISLSAGDGGQELIGGAGSDTLDGGPGADSLRGRGGNDTLLIGNQGFDIASGGKGADRFVVDTKPVLQPVGIKFKPKGPVSASEIRDLRPGQGDRLVLRASSFGPEVCALRRHMVVRQGANPSARGKQPQLLFGRRGSLLRYDRDGSGPQAPVVVAILRGHDRLPRRAIEIR